MLQRLRLIFAGFFHNNYFGFFSHKSMRSLENILSILKGLNCYRWRHFPLRTTFCRTCRRHHKDGLGFCFAQFHFFAAKIVWHVSPSKIYPMEWWTHLLVGQVFREFANPLCWNSGKKTSLEDWKARSSAFSSTRNPTVSVRVTYTAPW